jgi:predicted metal-dependent hydrolase
MSSPIPPYSLKISQRARSVRLQISREKGLIITIPVGFNQRLLPGIIQTKSDWIQKTFDHINKLPVGKPKPLPEKLELLAISETWLVVYRTEPGNKVQLVEQQRGKVLIISGKISSRLAVKRKLNDWLRERAVRLLPDWTERISRKTGLPFMNLTIRDQKTRWGSCSALKNVNLNQKLIFLPPHLVDYVIIHELCHTQVLSHSTSFWKLVSKYFPEYKAARKQLRVLAHNIPFQ